MKMNDCIKREDAEKMLLSRCLQTGYGGLTPDDVRETVKKIPPADVVEREEYDTVKNKMCEYADMILKAREVLGG